MSQHKRVIVLASHNPGKIREFTQLFLDSPFQIEAWSGSGEIVDETGNTYRDNAYLKAAAVARMSGKPALADDSGVEVDALGGLPGVQSARFVSEDAWVNSREILLRLMEVPTLARTARMRAVLCLVTPHAPPCYAEGVVEGTILTWARGSHGFGVDPIFSVDGRTSLAEYPEEMKNAVSHRARAVRALLAGLEACGAIPGVQ